MLSFDYKNNKNNEIQNGAISIQDLLVSQNTESDMFRSLTALNDLYIPTGLVIDNQNRMQKGGSNNICIMKEIGIVETEVFDHLFNSVCVVKKNKNKTVKKKKPSIKI
jgi:hypothetical protein